MTERNAQELLKRSYGEPLEQRRETLRQAMAAADAAEDLDQGHQIRMRYISACHNAPDSLEMIAAFGWCVARHDEDPERFPLELWYYKWVTNAARGFAGVSREQMNELSADMEARYKVASASNAPVLKERMFNAKWLGDLAEAEQLFTAWRDTSRSSRGGLNDCSACDVASEVDLLQVLGRHQEAIDVARPLIQRDLRCATEPHYAFARLLTSCRAVGDTDELAEQLSRDGLELIRDKPDFLQANGHHLCHFAASGNLVDALGLLRRTAQHATAADATLLTYARGARMTLRLAEAKDEADLGELNQQFDGLAEQIAARFDDRNGNDYISGLLTADDEELASQL